MELGRHRCCWARQLDLETHPNVVIDIQRPVLLPHRMDLGAAEDGALLWNDAVAAIVESKISFGDLASRRALDRCTHDRLDAIAEDADGRHARMSTQLLPETMR